MSKHEVIPMVNIKEFEGIVAKASAPLYKYCYYQLQHNKELAEETLNDVFCVLYKKWDSLDRRDNLMGWLFHVADLEIKQTKRKHNAYYNHIEPLEDSVKQNLENTGYTDEYFISDDLSLTEYIQQIEDSLSDDFKIIFRYRFVEKHTLMKTSQYLGIPYSSLRFKIEKIEKIVRRKITEIFEDS